MRRIVVVFAALVAVAGLLAWRWTHTPYGRMDLGAALVVHSMPGGKAEFTPEARRAANGWTARFMGDAEPDVAIQELTFPGPAGEQPLRLYTPSGEGPFPVVAWIHGGGFWMGEDLPMWDGTCSRLAKDAGAIVASIGYRLAPEHPFPAAVEDSFAGLRFVAEHASEWRGDATRLAVMGGSAGGNLAAVAALRARDEGGPALVLPGARGARGHRRGRRHGVAAELRARLRARRDPRHGGGVSAERGRPRELPGPRRCSRTVSTGLPPALILTAEFDPLRDEGERYAEKLRAAGVEVTLQRFTGAIHGFLGSSEDSAAGEALAAEKLREAFSSGAQ